MLKTKVSSNSITHSLKRQLHDSTSGCDAGARFLEEYPDHWQDVPPRHAEALAARIVHLHLMEAVVVGAHGEGVPVAPREQVADSIEDEVSVIRVD